MTLSTLGAVLLASPFASALFSLTSELLPLVVQFGQVICAFRKGPITPVTCDELETNLQRLLREIGRVTLQWVLNRLEPEDAHQATALLSFEQSIFRSRGRSIPAANDGTASPAYSAAPALRRTISE